MHSSRWRGEGKIANSHTMMYSKKMAAFGWLIALWVYSVADYHQTDAQTTTGLDATELNGILDPSLIGADYLLSFLDMRPADSSFPEQTQHKQQALTDHTNDEIYNSTTQQIVERSGFRQKTYIVTTKDGYKTELINVINPMADPRQLKQPPVVLFHGGVTNTNVWVVGSSIQHHPEKYPRTAADGPITSSNRSLGMMLTNYGYNVWLVATRGSNRQNIGHTTLKTKLLEDIDHSDPEATRQIADTLKYYEYTQDELVEFEYPAHIEKVLNLTGSSKISVITYSFSTHIMFKLLASNKELAKKIYANAVLEPLLDRIGMSTTANLINDFTMVYPIAQGNLLLQSLLTRATRDRLRSLDRYTTAYSIVTSSYGSSPKYQTFLEDPFIGCSLQMSSFAEIRHYAQQTLVGKLQKFDHGQAKNLQLYGQLTPPAYSLQDIRIKRWMLVSGDTDILGTLSSADKYASQIPQKPYRYIRLTNGWNHVDASAAFDVDVIVNLPIVEFFDHFSSTNATEIANAAT